MGRILASLIILVSLQTQASLFDRTLHDRSLFHIFSVSGVPEAALQRAFEFYDLNVEKKFLVRLDDKNQKEASIVNKKHIVIIDMSLPSSSRRLFLLNLEEGTVEKYFVAHGLNTGGDEAVRFSNIVESKQSSLGIYLTGPSYDGEKGIALKLYGLEPSNDKAYERNIVMHGADYVSLDFLAQYGRMGRSFGCPAVSKQIAQKIIPLIKDGTILSVHHKDLMKDIAITPLTQVSSKPIQEEPPTTEEVKQ